MTQVGVSGSIGSLLSFYKHERRIFGRCPHCGEPFRLSEVKLTYGKEPPKDTLSLLKKERDRLQESVDELQSEIDEIEFDRIREIEAVDDRWNVKFDGEVERRLLKATRQIRKDAVSRSRVTQLGKTLEKIAPMFSSFGHHPSDVRPIFDPVDFVIFDGYFQGKVTDITFVEFKTGQSRLTNVQTDIRAAVEKKRVHFQEQRLEKETIRMLCNGSPTALR